MLIDSHCHLNFPDFEHNLDDVLNRARKDGVKYFLTVNTCLTQISDLQELTKKYNDVFCSVGIHPHEADKYVGVNIQQELSKSIDHVKTVGIGETGLDFYYDHSQRDQQINSFEQHLQLAADCELPVIIHTRSADEDTVNCLKNHPKAKGVFHCFSSSKELAEKALDMGFYLSFSGIITFKKADEIRCVVEQTPMDRILIETDAPYLAPIPYRGKRNEPAHVVLTAQKIAEIKNICLKEVAKNTSDNFFNLFKKFANYVNGSTDIGSSKA